MIYEIFTVRDKAVGSFLPPFYCRSVGEALRSFTATVNEKDHQFNKYVEDYVLFSLGTFDDQSGTFASQDPLRVISAMEVLVPEDPFKPELEVSSSRSGSNGRTSIPMGTPRDR